MRTGRYTSAVERTTSHHHLNISSTLGRHLFVYRCLPVPQSCPQSSSPFRCSNLGSLLKVFAIQYLTQRLYNMCGSWSSHRCNCCRFPQVVKIMLLTSLSEGPGGNESCVHQGVRNAGRVQKSIVILDYGECDVRCEIMWTW